MDLRELRFRKRISQWELSRTSGVHQSRISLIENCFSTPTNDEKNKLAKALGLKPGEIEWEEKPSTH